MKRVKKSTRNLNNLGGKFSHVHMHLIGSIRAKLILAFLIPVIFIIILGYTSYAISSKAIIESFTSSTVNLITSTGNYYDVIMQSIQGKALELSTDYEIKGYYDKDYAEDPDAEVQQGVRKLSEDEVFNNINNKVSVLAVSDKFIEDVVIFTDYGYPLSTTGSFKDPAPYQSFKDTDEATVIKKDTWTGYHHYLDSQLGIDPSKYAITLTKQYINGSSKKTGFIVLDISMNVITDALTAMNLPEGSKAAFISMDGREIGFDLTGEPSIFNGQAFYEEALGSEATTYRKAIEFEGSKHLFIASKVGKTGAMVAALVPYEKITEKADAIKGWAVIIIILASAFAGITGIFVASGIGKNIRNMMQALSKAAAGDLTVKIHTRRKDEFHILANSINHMISNVKHLITEASFVGETVYSSSQHLTKNTELIVAASSEIATAIKEIQQGIQVQASDAEQCLKQTDHLTDQIHVVYDNSIAIGKISTDTKGIVTNGITVVDQLNEATKANLTITNETIKNMEELEKESKAITEIISVINDIAEQTNLLSLNASIEAARAGDAGKGFSVVAEEIRKLAEKSVHSADEIENIIHNINHKTQFTVSTVKQASTISQTTKARLSDVVNLFHDINIHVDDLADRMKRITEGIHDIDQAKNDTIKAIDSISAVAQETSAASEQMEATAGEQLEAVTRLNEASITLLGNADQLKAAIQLFTID